MDTISRTLIVLLFAASAAWLPAQDKPEVSKSAGKVSATVERTQAPTAPASKDKLEQKAITVSVTPFLTSADPLPLPSIPKHAPKNRRNKLKSAAGARP